MEKLKAESNKQKLNYNVVPKSQETRSVSTVDKSSIELNTIPSKSRDKLKESTNISTKSIASIQQPDMPKFDQYKPRIYTACKTGQTDSLRRLFCEMLQNRDTGIEKDEILTYLNQAVITSASKKQSTLLHGACLSGYVELVDLLLHFGCDPTLLDYQNRTAYQVCGSNALKDVFLRFREENDTNDKCNFDWLTTGIPVKRTDVGDDEPKCVKVKPELTEKQKAMKKSKGTLHIHIICSVFFTILIRTRAKIYSSFTRAKL